MKSINFMVAYAVIAILFSSCQNARRPDGQGRKQTNAPVNQHKEALFSSKGKKLVNDNRFNGTVWVNSLMTADSANQTAVGNVVFEPGAKSDWHIHPAGQILIVTGGTGYYQVKGQPKQIFHKGDVVKCPPNIPHWHGAAPDENFVQIAITGRQNGPTKWLEEVTNKEYNQ